MNEKPSLNGEIMDKSKALANNELGAGFFRAKDWESARACFELAHQLHPENPVYLKNLAEVCLQKGELTKARDYYTLVCKNEPNNKDLKMKLAKIYEALKEWETAYEMAPDDPEVLDRILGGIFNQYEGQCLSCGACCRNMRLVHQGQVISTREQFADFCRANPEDDNWQPVEDEAGVLRFNCRWLVTDNRCQIYQQRSEACRNYPGFRASTLQPGCGFHRKIDAGWTKIKNEKLLKEIFDYAAKIGVELKANCSAWW